MNELIALQGKSFDPRGVEADVLQNQMRQQALQSGSFDMQQKQDSLARQNAIRNALMQLPENSTPEAVSNLLTKYGAPEQAGAYMKAIREGQKFQLEGQKEQRQAQGFTQEQAIKAGTMLAQKYNAYVADPKATPDMVADDIVSMHAQGLIPRSVAEAKLKEVSSLTDPAQFRQYLKTHAQAGMNFVEQANANKPTYETMDLGGIKRTVARYPDGRVEVVRDDKVTVSPNTLASNGTQIQVAGMNIAGRAAEGDKDREVKISEGAADRAAKEGSDKPLTDSQSKALLFSTRMEASDKILNDLAKKGVKASVPGSQVPFVGRGINALSPADQQMLNQAKTDFLTAVLRRESGAVISDTEFATGDKQYFPQIGDSPEVIAQKAENRRIAREGIAAEVPEKKRGISAGILAGKPSGDGKRPSLDSIFK